MPIRCGLLAVGDRVLAVDDVSTVGAGATVTTQHIANTRPSLTLTIQFDVTERRHQRSDATDPSGDVTEPVSVVLPVKAGLRGVGISLTSKFAITCWSSLTSCFIITCEFY